MKKKILTVLSIGFIMFLFYAAYNVYRNYKRDKIRSVYYDNLKESASPTVTVLKDSILIGYQNEKRNIHIYVPPTYNKDTTSRYPVIYMLDGESSFNDMAFNGPEWQIDEVIDQASAEGRPTAIVIGIEQAEDRDAEYTPFINEDNPDAHGARFGQWVTQDLKQWVDTNYRTQSETSATSIGGISRSGMMAYYMLMAHPDIFGTAIIQSPAMWVDKEKLLAMKISTEELKKKKVFITVGENEGRVMIPDAKAIYEKFKTQGLEEDRLRFELIPDEGHWHVTWRKSFALGYPWFMG